MTSGRGRRRLSRVLEVGRTARRRRVLRVLRELGLLGIGKPATPEGAREFRHALEDLGTAYIKLGQLLSSRPELLPDGYIKERGHPIYAAPPVPFAYLDTVHAQS